ncbi:NACHT domain-containing protein [Hansschlegelia plantiphila]|uniref:Uncharacterized protein n=1 Tax=Hansschlegelia plantiphila TaxID=374655 RepID=A0A9W6MX77_9HYPH|nr:hypothetical protein [Hansschlegelia plantiphila]GLK69793.1 hypothetical protein GCM10008179_34310 [Hansschlegelia plantiphila]
MSDFIPLYRRFHDLTEKELADPEALALTEYVPWAKTGWPEVLASKRVVVLAEAGSGKTEEMRQQAKRMVGEGKAAFFVPLERLGRERLRDCLDADEEARLDAWMADATAPGYFFLDAVDELKLTAGKLDQALMRFAKDVGGSLDRTHVVISCRPNDWWHSIDAVAVGERLAVREKAKHEELKDAEQTFLEALRRRETSRTTDDNAAPKEPATPALRIVALLPLGNEQIQKFAERRIADAEAFLEEIGRQQAWTFARRPLDLIELIDLWKSRRRLGTRLDQHEASISARLKDAAGRLDYGALTDQKARDRAERLALALELTRTRTLRSPAQSSGGLNSEVVLDPADVLKDWSEKDRQALLRRALFDPATYGRVRFHHRSVQEYLAARRLQKLRANGMSDRALHRLLFAQQYGEHVVLPSMRPIAAWLALWDDTVRRELLAREPETLLSLGDPQSLDHSVRANLLRAFASSYGKGGWRGLNIPIREVRRLAGPELAAVIRELWDEASSNPDVRELLIEAIWQGPVANCSDLAERAALDPSWVSYHRVAAIRALAACGDHGALVRVVRSIMTEPERWPASVIPAVSGDLFPKHLSVDELIALIERTPESKSVASGFGWELPRLVRALEPRSPDATALRDKLAELIWEGRVPGRDHYDLTSKFSYLAQALASLCERQLDQGIADADLIAAAVVASRFEDRNTVDNEPGKKLRAAFRDVPALRDQAFWRELNVMDETAPTTDARQRFFQAEYDSLIGNVEQADRHWLETALADLTQPDRRPVALQALLRLWGMRGGRLDEVSELRESVRDDPDVPAVIDHQTMPLPAGPADATLERRTQRRELVRKGREVQRVESWKKWRRELIDKLDDAFSAAKSETTLHYLYLWLEAQRGSGHRFDVWDRKTVAEAFSPEVAERAAQGFRAVWRTEIPAMWSARPPDERNTTPYRWIYGLSGIAGEREVPGWAEGLSADEARRAAAYAPIELNGLAPFIVELARVHPDAVEQVLGEELAAQLGQGADHGHLTILEDLSYAAPELQRLFVPRLLRQLETWPDPAAREAAAAWKHHLEQALKVLEASNDAESRTHVASICATRFEQDPAGPMAISWLAGLFRFDPAQATRLLVEALAREPGVRGQAVEMFAALFGQRDANSFGIEKPLPRAAALGQLVRAAYANVRMADDNVHEGSYTPNRRDEAERARGYLLQALLATPGQLAHDEIVALSDEPDFAHFPDRLKLLARQSAARDAEFPAFSADDIVALDTQFEAPPHDRDGLFQLMLDRLDDEAEYIAHHEFTTRKTLRSIKDETEMQRTLAGRLDAQAKGAYRVVRENEAADAKRNDIQLLAVRGDQMAAIEVKIADNRYSVAELEWALEHQLVGQYLRHERCKAGCFLLTYHGRKGSWEHPVTSEPISFEQVILYLSDKAAALEAGSNGDYRLAVVGLDLNDPPLVQAQLGRARRAAKTE